MLASARGECSSSFWSRNDNVAETQNGVSYAVFHSSLFNHPHRKCVPMQMKIRLLIGLLIAVSACNAAPGDAPGTSSIDDTYTTEQAADAVPTERTADQIVEGLLEGNRRFARGRTGDLPRIDPRRRAELVAGQAPQAVILSCADSRVPPEHVFRQGLGDIFVARVAGNVPLVGEIASIEYAVEHLHVPVLMVLGHSACGAVTAAVEQSRAATELTPSLTALVNEIMPAVREAEKSAPDESELVDAAVHINAQFAASNLLERSSVIRDAADAGHLKVVVGVYDLASGLVSLEDATSH